MTTTTNNCSNKAKKLVSFCFDQTVIHTIPTVQNPQEVWWQPQELQDVKTQVEQQVLACRAYLTKSPWAFPIQSTQRQTCQALQGLVGCTRQLLLSQQHAAAMTNSPMRRPKIHYYNNNNNNDGADLLVERLAHAMQGTAALRGLEARLVPTCRQVAQQHIRQVLRGSSSPISQSCALLAQVRAKYDAA